ncbi:MAG: hypothetical protein EB121_05875 [Alphaproteobacteria bacterium]|nr:hypothetical protein [Alphaproteobacteria bacterium]NDG04859.1 hypothetical protein [Alphaproteobacteria bacterium]
MHEAAVPARGWRQLRSPLMTARQTIVARLEQTPRFGVERAVPGRAMPSLPPPRHHWRVVQRDETQQQQQPPAVAPLEQGLPLSSPMLETPDHLLLPPPHLACASRPYQQEWEPIAVRVQGVAHQSFLAKRHSAPAQPPPRQSLLFGPAQPFVQLGFADNDH